MSSLATLSFTVNDAVLPSVAVVSSIRSDGSAASSSSVIVPIPVPSSMVAPSGLLSSTVKDSSGSFALSSRVDTRMVRLSVPG